MPKDRINNLSMLDVGAGKGRMTKEFIKIARTCVAIEPFHEFYNFLKSNFENIGTYRCTLNEYAKIADKKFDIIFISGVICYLTDDELSVFCRVEVGRGGQ